jgi:MFS family permease
MPYLSSIDITRSTSSLIATAIPLVSIVGRLALGWLGDRFSRRLVTAFAFGVMGLGSLCFGYAAITGTWLLVPFLVLFGVGYGGCNALRPSLVRDYFGRANFGTIFGMVMGVNMLGSIMGPPVAGWAYDNWGSYQGIWFVFASLPVISLISILTMPPTSGPALPPTVLDSTPRL